VETFGQGAVEFCVENFKFFKLSLAVSLVAANRYAMSSHKRKITQ